MSPKPDRQLLYEIASEQIGHFTARQAVEAGYGTDDIAYHTRKGDFIRELPGVYRLLAYPDSPRGDVMAAWLAVGKDRSVVSHESALDLLELGTLIPNAVRITVPRSRRNLPHLPGVRIHTTTRPIEPRDTVVREGILLTSPARTIVDAAATNIGPEQVEMAVAQALDRALTTRERLEAAAHDMGTRVQKQIARAVERYEGI